MARTAVAPLEREHGFAHVMAFRHAERAVTTSASRIAEPGRQHRLGPEVNVAVRVGSRYLGDLFALFPENPAAVAASYNGGEDNVARWARRAADPNDVDLVIAEVSFKETKTYVYRVMNNYWAYQALYTRELNDR